MDGLDVAALFDDAGGEENFMGMLLVFCPNDCRAEALRARVVGVIEDLDAAFFPDGECVGRWPEGSESLCDGLIVGSDVTGDGDRESDGDEIWNVGKNGNGNFWR